MTLILKRPTGTGLILKRPVGAKLELTPTNLLPDDPDAIAYITAVEAADGQALEPATRLAFNNFVRGCKVDGTWPALRACCLMVGARTLTGALVPLVGPAPTNFNFVVGDYDRKTGLKGDGSTKYLNANLNNNATAQNNHHHATHITTASNQGAIAVFIGGGQSGVGTATLGYASINIFNRSKNSTPDQGVAAAQPVGFYGISRSNASTYDMRLHGTNYSRSLASDGNQSAPTGIFARIDSVNAPLSYNNARLSYYSIGQSLNLALLDARVSALMAALAVAIP